jgi:hypothetical protein
MTNCMDRYMESLQIVSKVSRIIIFIYTALLDTSDMNPNELKGDRASSVSAVLVPSLLGTREENREGTAADHTDIKKRTIIYPHCPCIA